MKQTIVNNEEKEAFLWEIRQRYFCVCLRKWSKYC